MADTNQDNLFDRPNPVVMGEEQIIPVVKEHLTITSRQVTTGEVIVEKHVVSETIAVPLTTVSTSYRELRISANRVVDVMPQTRMEGGNIIIPVVREEEVVIKRIILVEEIHLIKTTEVDERTEDVELHTETATVSRSANNQELQATSE